MNVGEYCFDNKALFNALNKVTNNNAQNEYYITDVIGIMNQDGLKVDAYKIEDFNEVGGINDRLQLAEATEMLKLRINKEHLLNGVNIIDINNTYIGRDVVIGKETTIEPGCIIKGNTVIGDNCHIGPYCEFNNVTIKDNVEIKFSVISDSIIESGTDIGPYARLRTNCHIRENVHMGNFVEMKNADFGKGSKAAHLTYIGDAKVGENVNIGCGTITVNYDGKNKSLTQIEDNAFIGCNSNLVAPVTIKKDAFIAAGSTITKDVEENAMGIARARQINKEGYSAVLKERSLKKYNELKKNK
jgi:bifunctional UDP-N-acetylglucosamine pyrophosphorylase/glucosamine-1-phosphate N-acetyltransferase